MVSIPGTYKEAVAPMTISLVVCTRNRAAWLPQTLEALSALRMDRPWELVFVNNGSTDDTGRILSGFAAPGHCSVTIVDEPVAGLGRARNAGWRAASGDILVFTDDDCYPDPEFLSAVESCFAGRERLGVVGGRVLLYDPSDAPMTIQTRADPVEITPRSFIPAGLIHGANFSFRRAALEAVGGFDERFGAGTKFPCEDVDVIARICAEGWEGRYDPAPVVYHHHRRKAADVPGLMRGYDLGRGAYYAKCILDPRLRYVYLKHWAYRLRRQSLRRSRRELSAAAQFLWQNAFGKR